MVLASAAGQEAVLPVVPVLPPAATTVTPRFTAYWIAFGDGAALDRRREREVDHVGAVVDGPDDPLRDVGGDSALWRDGPDGQDPGAGRHADDRPDVPAGGDDGGDVGAVHAVAEVEHTGAGGHRLVLDGVVAVEDLALQLLVVGGDRRVHDGDDGPRADHRGVHGGEAELVVGPGGGHLRQSHPRGDDHRVRLEAEHLPGRGRGPCELGGVGGRVDVGREHLEAATGVDDGHHAGIGHRRGWRGDLGCRNRRRRRVRLGPRRGAGGHAGQDGRGGAQRERDRDPSHVPPCALVQPDDTTAAMVSLHHPDPSPPAWSSEYRCRASTTA